MRTLIASDKIANALVNNHAYVPRPTRAIFNVGTKKVTDDKTGEVYDKKVRVTVVYFDDGTKVNVTLSERDTFNKETAVLQAVAKRAYGEIRFDDKKRPFVHGNGTGIMIGKIVKASFDQEAFDKKMASKNAEKEAAKVTAVPQNTVNKAKKAAYAKSYYQKNRDKILADRRKRYHNNPEYRSNVLKSAKASYKKHVNKAKRAAYAKSYYQKNRDKVLAKMKQYYANKRAKKANG